MDFDYDEFEKYEEDDYEEEDDDLDDYIEDEDEGNVLNIFTIFNYFILFNFTSIWIGEARARKAKKIKAKRPTRKSIFEIYEPSELKRGHFTDLDNEVSFPFILLCTRSIAVEKINILFSD